jgi:hypothetical protein
MVPVLSTLQLVEAVLCVSSECARYRMLQNVPCNRRVSSVQHRPMRTLARAFLPRVRALHRDCARRRRSILVGCTRRYIVVGVALFLISLPLRVAKRALLVIKTGLIQLLFMLGHRHSFRSICAQRSESAW